MAAQLFADHPRGSLRKKLSFPCHVPLILAKVTFDGVVVVVLSLTLLVNIFQLVRSYVSASYAASITGKLSLHLPTDYCLTTVHVTRNFTKSVDSPHR